MLKYFMEAFAGEKIWKKIPRTNDDKSLILIFPDNDKEISYYGLLYADSIAKKCGFKHIITVSDKKIIKKASNLLVKTDKESITLSPKHMASLLRYLSMRVDCMGFSIFKNVVFISAFYPFGASQQLLRDNNIFSSDHLVWNRMYHVLHSIAWYGGEKPEVKPPVYKGNDKELADFLGK